MGGLRAHDFQCAREVMRAVAQSSTDESGVPTDQSWTGYRIMAWRAAIPRYHACHSVAAMMVIWLLARKLYATPAEFEQEMGVLLGPMIMGDIP